MTVSVDVTTRDNVNQDMTAKIGTRSLRRMPDTPDTIYLDAVNGSDFNSGRDGWNDAKQTLDAALTVAAASADQILIKSGEYQSVKKLRTSSSSSRVKFIVLRGVDEDVSIKSDASEWERRTIESWIGFEDIDFKMASYVADEAEYTNWTLTEDHLMFKNCNFTYAGTGANFGSIKTATGAGPHISFMGCKMEGGNRGIVVAEGLTEDGEVENGYGMILHNILFTNLGTTMRLQWSDSLYEYITSTGNLEDPSNWDPGAHFNMCNTGLNYMEEVIYRGIMSYDNASSPGSLRNYSFMQFNGELRNIALLDSYSYCFQDSQQVITFTNGSSPGRVVSNMQFSGLVIGQTDWEDDDGGLRGINFYRPGVGQDPENYTYQDMLFRNIATTILYLPHDTTNNWVIESIAAVNDRSYFTPDIYLDGDMINGNALLQGLNNSDPSPSLGSALLVGSRYGREFDLFGRVRGDTPAIGAAEPDPGG